MPIKIYTATLNQSGIDDPVLNVYQNTIGSITWVRQSVGAYIGTSIGKFIDGKTIVPPFGDVNSGVVIPINDINTGGYYAIYPVDADIIKIYSFDSNGASKDLSGLIGAASIFIEIRVYP